MNKLQILSHVAAAIQNWQEGNMSEDKAIEQIQKVINRKEFSPMVKPARLAIDELVK
jgi:hypothetical protein